MSKKLIEIKTKTSEEKMSFTIVNTLKYMDNYLDNYFTLLYVCTSTYRTPEKCNGLINTNMSINFDMYYKILLALFAFICMEYYIMNRKNSIDINRRGRYRYVCSGKSVNNKRCKRRVKNSDVCYQHNNNNNN
jgi:hypothetical protein